ncbi:hypothetical protein ACW9H6_20885 [Pseudomonas sp. SDO528_S397]
MSAIKNLVLALTMLSATAGAQASDGPFAAFGNQKSKKSSSPIYRVSIEHLLALGAPWGASLGQQVPKPAYRVGYENLSGHLNGIKLRQQDLQGRYDIPQSES